MSKRGANEPEGDVSHPIPKTARTFELGAFDQNDDSEGMDVELIPSFGSARSTATTGDDHCFDLLPSSGASLDQLILNQSKSS